MFANDTADLDDIKLYDIVKVEQCLDQAYDTVPGHARKLEFKLEGDDPVYEFDIESTKDGFTYNVECNAEEGYITEVEKEVEVPVEDTAEELYDIWAVSYTHLTLPTNREV